MYCESETQNRQATHVSMQGVSSYCSPELQCHRRNAWLTDDLTMFPARRGQIITSDRGVLHPISHLLDVIWPAAFLHNARNLLHEQTGVSCNLLLGQSTLVGSTAAETLRPSLLAVVQPIDATTRCFPASAKVGKRRAQLQLSVVMQSWQLKSIPP